MRMIAVSALEEDPPRRPARSTSKKRKQNQPLHWILLTTEGRADLDTARTVLRWYELRWRIERFFHALKVGTRIEDRRLDEADDLRKCLAFDAITAFRVWELSLLARERPNDPASRHVTEDDIKALCDLASHYGFRVPRGPPEMTIAGFVVLTGGLPSLEAPAATRHPEALGRREDPVSYRNRHPGHAGMETDKTERRKLGVKSDGLMAAGRRHEAPAMRASLRRTKWRRPLPGLRLRRRTQANADARTGRHAPNARYSRQKTSFSAICAVGLASAALDSCVI